MRKRIFLITILFSALGVFGCFAQSGAAPKLAASGKEAGHEGHAQTSSAKPVMATSAVKSNKENAHAAQVKPAPRLAASENKSDSREQKK